MLRSIGTVSASALSGSTLFGTVVAEDVETEELERFANEPNVRAILRELGEDTIPESVETDKRRIEKSDEFVMCKIKFPYGTLLVAEYDGRTGAMFTFGDDLSEAPAAYRSLPDTDASLVVTETGDVEFKRLATEREKERVLAALDVDEDAVASAMVYTGTAVDGFRADVGMETADSDTTETRSYRLTGGPLDDFDPKRDRLRATRSNATAPSFSVERIEAAELNESPSETGDVGIASPSRREVIESLVLDYIAGHIATDLAEKLGPCGPSCVSCADYASSLLLDCTTCRVVCGTGLTPQGAIVCVFCIYLWCGQDPLRAVDCARCPACLIEGEPPADPRDEIWDELPSGPSLPF